MDWAFVHLTCVCLQLGLYLRGRICLEVMRGIGSQNFYISGNFLRFLRERCKLLIRYISWQYVFYSNLNTHSSLFYSCFSELQHWICICNTCCCHPRITDYLAFHHCQNMGIHTLPTSSYLIWISSEGSPGIILWSRLYDQGWGLSSQYLNYKWRERCYDYWKQKAIMKCV